MDTLQYWGDWVKIDMNTETVAVLVASFYEMGKEIESSFISENVYMAIAERLCELIDDWDIVGVPFLDWCSTILLIYPKIALSPANWEMIKDNQLLIEVNGLVATAWLGENV